MRRVGLPGILASVVGLLLAAGAQARTYSVTAGPIRSTGNQQLDMDAYFAKSVTIHVGDKVRWSINGLHTVTFVPPGKTPPAFVTPDATHKVSGINDANGVPFWFNGQPSLVINPIAAFGTGGPKVTGGKLVSSAIPAGAGKPKPVTFRFTRRGTFNYMCLVHPGMTGVVKVVSRSRRIASPAAVKKAALRQFKAAVRLGKRRAQVTPPANTVYAGHDRGPVAWLRFFPSSLTVKIGQPVTFKVSSRPEAHTVTFGPPAYTDAIQRALVSPIQQSGGLPILALNPLGLYPSDPPSAPLPADTGANHGNGFVNAGILDTDAHTPQPSTATFTFTKAGTYPFECVLHAGMHGTITVIP